MPSSAETRASAVFALTESAPNDMWETKNGTSRTSGRSARRPSTVRSESGSLCRRGGCASWPGSSRMSSQCGVNCLRVRIALTGGPLCSPCRYS